MLPAVAQQSLDPDTNPAGIPTNFKLDLETAARVRPQLLAQSIAATGRYANGRLVFDRLVGQVRAPADAKLAWELRIVADGQRNAFSSPDGTVYVENGLAQLAGPSTGLWAAILSHEIAHVVRRDWARRYLYQKSLQNGGGASIVLGDPGLPSASWENSEKASADMARFCRRLEEEADHDGLMLMARAGYHPDFVPALHHLLHAQGADSPVGGLYAMHPCWEERDRELKRAYQEASIEFERRWPEWYASPGGDPPIVVFAEAPTVKKTGSRDFEIRVPMRCQNLAGAVEVVLRAGSDHGKTARPERLPDLPGSDEEMRQLTGCTSPKTTITFAITDASGSPRSSAQWTDVYVVDAWGAVLARADVPKLR
jgi:peptidase M48-like protein